MMRDEVRDGIPRLELCDDGGGGGVADAGLGQAVAE